MRPVTRIPRNPQSLLVAYLWPRAALAAAVIITEGDVAFSLERQLELGRCSGGLDGWGIGRESQVREDAYDHRALGDE